MIIEIRSPADIERHFAGLRSSAMKIQSWIKAHEGDALDLLRALKFEPVGAHPIAAHALNAIEQINQTFTFAVALEAARHLLERHPEAGGFYLAPGAHMSKPLDIMSIEDGVVGAETFAAVDPRNNRKLAKDLDKLATCNEQYRYVFFASPLYPGHARCQNLERDGIEVWSVQV